MKEVIVVESTPLGLFDYSPYLTAEGGSGRLIANIGGRTMRFDGLSLYNMGGDTKKTFDTGGLINLSNKSFTIELWVHNTMGLNYVDNYLLSNVNTDWATGFYMGFNPTGFVCSSGDGARDSSNFSDIVPQNVNTHIAIIYDGIYRILFINGELRITERLNNGVHDTGEVYLGHVKAWNGEYPSQSLLGQIILWDGIRYTKNFQPIFNTYNYSYNGVISGDVRETTNEYEKYTPIETDVFIFDNSNKVLYNTVKSDSSGHYEFRNLGIDKEYFTIAIHGSDIVSSGILKPVDATP